MGQKWKGTVEARKLRFLELYEACASRSMLMNELGMVRHDVDGWCYTIRIFGASQFLMSHTSKTHYSYETKLAAVKARPRATKTKYLCFQRHPSTTKTGRLLTESPLRFMWRVLDSLSYETRLKVSVLRTLSRTLVAFGFDEGRVHSSNAFATDIGMEPDVIGSASEHVLS